MVLKLLYSFCFEKIIETLILNLALLKYLEITLYNLGQYFGGKRWNSESSKPKNLKSMRRKSMLNWYLMNMNMKMNQTIYATARNLINMSQE